MNIHQQAVPQDPTVKPRLLIVGCGMATAHLLEKLVAGGFSGAIEVVGAEPGAAYNRVLLSALLAGDKQESDLSLLEDSWYAAHNISLATGESVVALDVLARTATTDRQRIIAWDQLVIATGSRVALPVFPGSEQAGILGFRSKADLQLLQQAARRHANAVVLGGGLLGLEAAFGLHSLGMNITVVHRQPWLLNRQLDEEGGRLLQSRLETLGIDFRLGVQASTFRDANLQLELDDGSLLDCPVLVAATGIIPNRELAGLAGIACDRGILVDSRMQTSQADVFALGECCQHGRQCYGLVAPVYEQARVLAEWLCGNPAASYQFQDSAVHLKVAGVAMVSSGYLAPDNGENQVLRDPVQGTYRRLVIENNRVRGFVLVGNKQHAAWYQQLQESGTDIRSIRPWLMFGEQESAGSTLYLPEVKYAGH